MTGPFAAHPGTHAVPRAPIFRLGLRMPWRKPAVPAGVAAGTATALINDAAPVLRDRWVSDVRREYDATSTAELAVLREPGQPPARPVRLQRPDGEILIDERSRITVRPVNGRYLGTQPRLRPVRALDAERDAAREAGERARVRYEPASVPLLRQVLAGLRKL